MSSRKPNNSQRKTTQSSRPRAAQQEDINREPQNHYLIQEHESLSSGINYERYLNEHFLEQSPLWQVHHNMQRLRQLESPVNIPRLDMDEPDYQRQESESEISSVSDIAVRVIRRRNREKLCPQERRRFNNMMKFLISAIKSYIDLYVFDQMQHDDLVVEEQIEIVFDLLIGVLKKLSSRSAKKMYLIMLFNDFDPSLNKFIQGKTKKTRAQKDYLKIVEKYSPEIINYAKNILRAVVRNALKDELIAKEAQDRGFYGIHEEKRRIKFQMYFKNFRQQLRNNKIKQIVKKKNVLSQALYQP